MTLTGATSGVPAERAHGNTPSTDRGAPALHGDSPRIRERRVRCRRRCLGRGGRSGSHLLLSGARSDPLQHGGAINARAAPLTHRLDGRGRRRESLGRPPPGAPPVRQEKYVTSMGRDVTAPHWGRSRGSGSSSGGDGVRSAARWHLLGKPGGGGRAHLTPPDAG